MAKNTPYEVAKKDLKTARARLTQFNKEKRKGITGIEARLRRGRELEIRQSIKTAEQAVKQFEPKKITCNFSLEELKWLGYKSKADYIRKHTK